jgi:hypothetical protein
MTYVIPREEVESVVRVRRVGHEIRVIPREGVERRLRKKPRHNNVEVKVRDPERGS